MSKELEITADRVKEAADECPESKDVLDKLFPGVITPDFTDLSVETAAWAKYASSMMVKNAKNDMAYAVNISGEYAEVAADDCRITITRSDSSCMFYRSSLGKHSWFRVSEDDGELDAGWKPDPNSMLHGELEHIAQYAMQERVRSNTGDRE